MNEIEITITPEIYEGLIARSAAAVKRLHDRNKKILAILATEKKSAEIAEAIGVRPEKVYARVAQALNQARISSSFSPRIRRLLVKAVMFRLTGVPDETVFTAIVALQKSGAAGKPVRPPSSSPPTKPIHRVDGLENIPPADGTVPETWTHEVFTAKLMEPSMRASLRAFAISLCGNIDRADDLVQETFLRALTAWESFEAYTNLPAWLFTILRNLFRSQYRKRRREVEDGDGRYAETLKSHPEQTGRVEFEEFRTALARLPTEQREALLLVGASGFSYDDAARICGCAVGTIKSRVNRARSRLADLLAIDSLDDFGPDRPTRAVLAGGGRT